MWFGAENQAKEGGTPKKGSREELAFAATPAPRLALPATPLRELAPPRTRSCAHFLTLGLNESKRCA